MSRSANNETQNPCTRWMEWSGSKGTLSFYDKNKEGEKKDKTIDVPIPFTFIVLDTLATIKGWHDGSDSGIYSNEVKDTTKQPLVVKAFKGGVLAEGYYRDIKDKVGNNGGNYIANIYCAYKGADGKLAIGCLQLKGAGLNAWVEFKNRHKADIMKQAVVVTGSVDGKKGTVLFKTPTFKMSPVSEETNTQALALDKILQEHFDIYFSKKLVVEQIVEPIVPVVAETPPTQEKGKAVYNETSKSIGEEHHTEPLPF